MKIVSYTGDCPKCGEIINIIKTNSHKRFAKCDNPDCDVSYPLPKKGKIDRSGLKCPDSGIPILMIIPTGHNVGKPYFWTQQPCFGCKKFESTAEVCEETKILVDEFTENDEYNFGKKKTRV